MRIVVSLGNSAMFNPDVHRASGDRFLGIHNAALSVHALMDAGHSILLTYGHEHSLDENDSRKLPGLTSVAGRFDLQEAQREALIGYLLEQELRSTSDCKRSFVNIVTHVLVDANDPAFQSPANGSKVYVGPTVDESTATELKNTKHWTMKKVGDGYRRELPSPEPVTVLQSDAIEQLLNSGKFGVLCSGSGIAVTRDVQRCESGVDAVVDKDKTAALLARDIDADALLILTDVLGVYKDWNTPQRTLLPTLQLGEIESMDLDTGSMKPKIEAARMFVARGGFAGIGAVGDALAILSGSTGTRIVI